MNAPNPLQAQAYDYLKEQIISGKLEPDILYSETKLASELGISRTPMREALRVLSQDGYIHIIPSKGFQIRQLGERDMKETIQVRCAIEGFCIYTIANDLNSKKSTELLHILEDLLKKQEHALTSPVDLGQFMEYDHEFHLTLIHYADNQEFLQIFQRLMYLIQLTTAKALSVPRRTEDTLKEHKQIFSCLKEGKADIAYRLMMEHLTAPLLLLSAEYGSEDLRTNMTVTD